MIGIPKMAQSKNTMVHYPKDVILTGQKYYLEDMALLLWQHPGDLYKCAGTPQCLDSRGSQYDALWAEVVRKY